MREGITLAEQGWEYVRKIAAQQKRIDYAWAAGFFDGEGCIRINKQKRKNGYQYGLQLSVANVVESPVKKFYELFGGNYKLYSSGRYPNARPIYRWHITSVDAIRVLNVLLPNLRVKWEQALVAIEFQETFTKPRHKLTDKEQVARELSFVELKRLKWKTEQTE